MLSRRKSYGCTFGLISQWYGTVKYLSYHFYKQATSWSDVFNPKKEENYLGFPSEHGRLYKLWFDQFEATSYIYLIYWTCVRLTLKWREWPPRQHNCLVIIKQLDTLAFSEHAHVISLFLYREKWYYQIFRLHIKWPLGNDVS